MKKKNNLVLLFLLLPLLSPLIPLAGAPDDLIYFQDFEGTPGSWTTMNPYNSSWNFANGTLNGYGLISEWDDIVLDDLFNLSDYTVVFDVLLFSGYGEDQFHFIFDYYSGYTVMELGSTPGYCHYIDRYGGWYDFSYNFPLDKWATVYLIAEFGQLELWVNDEMILSNMTMNVPILENIGFGFYSYSAGHFDNLYVYSGIHRPDQQPVDDTIFYDEFSRYNLGPYVWTHSVNWSIDNYWLRGYSNPGDKGWLMTTDLDIHEDLYEYTIELDYDIHIANGDILLLGWRMNSSTDFHFIRYSPQRDLLEYGYENEIAQKFTIYTKPMDYRLTWGRLYVATRVDGDQQFTEVFLQEEDHNPYLAFTYDETNLYKCGNIAFGIDSTGIYNETLVFWDNIWIRRGFYPPKIDDKPIDEGFTMDDFAISSGDTFTFELSEYTGVEPEVDLTGWFRDVTVDESLPLSLAQGDQLAINVFDFVDWGIEVEVYKNSDDYIGKGVSNFLFLPIYGNLSNFRMFEGTSIVVESDAYSLTWNYSDNNASDDGILEFRWSKMTGVLESLELISGSISPEGSAITTFLFELVDSTTDGPDDNTTIPTISPGWEFISLMGILISIPILSRRKRA